jgi:hypothetical protein
MAIKNSTHLMYEKTRKFYEIRQEAMSHGLWEERQVIAVS